MKRLSIGVRLTVWYVAVFALGELIFGASMWFLLRDSVFDLVDDGLESQVEDVKTFLQNQKHDTSITNLSEELNETYGGEHPGDFLQVSIDAGHVLYQSAFLKSHPSVLFPPSQIKETEIRTRHAGAQHFRFLFEKLNVNGQMFTIEMGAPADDAVDTLNLFRSYLLMFAPLLLLFAAGVGYWMSRRALSPVDALVGTAREIGGANLNSRLQKLETGDELQRLSDTLNEMLDRIENAFLRVTQFTADASHELRTPMSLIRTEAELALRRSRGEEEYRESLRHILDEAERTTLLVERLLELARADSGREAIDLRQMDIGQVFHKVTDGWQQVAAIRSLEFTSNICDQNMVVLADESLLRRLADILLDNAFKYTPPPGSVKLEVRPSEDKVVITVRDTGVGIAKEEQGRIFERFYRVDKARSRGQGGTGLGLAIAQCIVAQHHGSITVESELGQGAVFRVELPKAAAPVQSALPV